MNKSKNKQEDWKDKIKDICWQLVDVDRDYQYSPSSIKEAIKIAISKTEEHFKKNKIFMEDDMNVILKYKEQTEKLVNEARQETAKKILDWFEEIQTCSSGYEEGSINDDTTLCYDGGDIDDWEKKIKKEFIENEE